MKEIKETKWRPFRIIICKFVNKRNFDYENDVKTDE